MLVIDLNPVWSMYVCVFLSSGFINHYSPGYLLLFSELAGPPTIKAKVTFYETNGPIIIHNLQN